MHHNGTYTSSLMHHIWSRLQGTASTALDTDHALGTLCEMILFTIYAWTIAIPLSVFSYYWSGSTYLLMWQSNAQEKKKLRMLQGVLYCFHSYSTETCWKLTCKFETCLFSIVLISFSFQAHARRYFCNLCGFTALALNIFNYLRSHSALAWSSL